MHHIVLTGNINKYHNNRELAKILSGNGKCNIFIQIIPDLSTEFIIVGKYANKLKLKIAKELDVAEIKNKKMYDMNKRQLLKYLETIFTLRDLNKNVIINRDK